MNSSSCPKCKSSNLRLCHVVYAEGTATITTKTQGAAMALGPQGQLTPVLASGTTSGQQQSLLAAMCTPPKRRDPTTAVMVLTVVYVIFCFATSGNGLFAIPIYIILVLLMIGKAGSYNQKIWPTLFESWRQRQICLDCHTMGGVDPIQEEIKLVKAIKQAAKVADVELKAMQVEIKSSIPFAPWYERTSLTIIFFLLFWPVGIAMLLFSRRVPTVMKGFIIAGCLGMMTLLICAIHAASWKSSDFNNAKNEISKASVPTAASEPSLADPIIVKSYCDEVRVVFPEAVEKSLLQRNGGGIFSESWVLNPGATLPNNIIVNSNPSISFVGYLDPAMLNTSNDNSKIDNINDDAAKYISSLSKDRNITYNEIYRSILDNVSSVISKNPPVGMIEVPKFKVGGFSLQIAIWTKPSDDKAIQYGAFTVEMSIYPNTN